jgi:hypothetical protein
LPILPRDTRRTSLATARSTARALLVSAAILASVPAGAVTPVGPLVNSLITLDGTALGSQVANRSSVPTILHDSATQTYHMWVQVADETAFTSAGVVPLRIASYRHATSVDGIAFTTAATLSFAGSPFAATIYGSSFGEPPWVYPKASLWSGNYTLGLWTFNDGFSGTPYPGTVGDYNYNISLNDLGASPANASPTHMGPVGAAPGNGIFAQTAGHFGIVAGVMYYDNNSLLGRAALTDNGAVVFPATSSTGPWRVTATNAAVADTLTPLGYIACHLAGGNSYLHNSARVIDNGDGTLGFFYTIRNCDGSRKDSQVYYMESADGGLTWSSPVGIFAGAATIGGNALLRGFTLADVVVVNGQRVVYFNSYDAQDRLIVGAAPPAIGPRAPAKPVPVDTTGMLAAIALLLATGAAWALRRGRVNRR